MNIIAKMTKNKQEKVKAEISDSKKLVAKTQSKIKQEQIKPTVEESVVVMKESRTLILD